MATQQRPGSVSSIVPIGSIRQPLDHRTLLPDAAEASVYDVMRIGIFSCPPETPVREVARMMDTYRIHAVVVSGLSGAAEPEWGIVADLDLLAVVGRDPTMTAEQLASTEFVTVAADESLVRAAQLMSEHETAHLVVIEPAGSRPVGVVSTLDVAAALAWGEPAEANKESAT